MVLREARILAGRGRFSLVVHGGARGRVRLMVVIVSRWFYLGVAMTVVSIVMIIYNLVIRRK